MWRKVWGLQNDKEIYFSFFFFFIYCYYFQPIVFYTDEA